MKIFCSIDGSINDIYSIGMITSDGNEFFAEVSLDRSMHVFVYNKKTKSARICDVAGSIKKYIGDWLQDLIEGPVSWRDDEGKKKKEDYEFEIWTDNATCDLIYDDDNMFGAMFSKVSSNIYPIPMNIENIFEQQSTIRCEQIKMFSNFNNELLTNSLIHAEMLKKTTELLFEMIEERAYANEILNK